MAESTLSVIMIVRDEEDVLADILTQAVVFADELIIVDTGSNDNTRSIARLFTDKVYDFPWEGDFAKARNVSLSYATMDYVMPLDADHILTPENTEKIRALKSRLAAYNSVLFTYLPPENGGVPIAYHMIMRRDGRQWTGAINELMSIKEPVLQTDIVLGHRVTPSCPPDADRNGTHRPYRDYCRYVKRLDPAVIRDIFWIGIQCYVDLVLTGEREMAGEALRLTLSCDPSLAEMFQPCLLAGNNFMYWRVPDEALFCYRLILDRLPLDAPDFVCPPEIPLCYLRMMLMHARKCSYRIGEVALSVRYNAIALRLFPESLAAQVNARWFARFAPVTISVCMIVRDEEAVLERCLKTAVQFADELIVVDTGSVDKSREIACRYTDRVYDYTWQDDFAAARNFSYSKASGDYIMWLDADDDIEAESIARIQALKAHMPPETDVVSFLYGSEPVPDSPNDNSCLIRDRLVRRALEPRWEHAIHEAIPLKQSWHILNRPDIVVLHRKVRDNPPRRNIRIFEKLLAGGEVLDSFYQAYYCRELCVDAQYEAEADAFRKLFREGCRAEIDYAMLFHIVAMRQLKRYDVLEQELRAYVARFGPNEMVSCTLGDCCRRNGHYDEAIRLYEEALGTMHDVCDYTLWLKAYNTYYPWAGLAKIYLRQGRWADAEHAIGHLRHTWPDVMETKILSLSLEVCRRRKRWTGDALE